MPIWFLGLVHHMLSIRPLLHVHVHRPTHDAHLTGFMGGALRHKSVASAANGQCFRDFKIFYTVLGHCLYKVDSNGSTALNVIVRETHV
jgi:hypothetical protein